MTDPNLPEIPSSEEKRPEPSVERSKPAMEKEATGAPFGTPGWERATLERLAFASLEEQRSARRWRNFVRLAWLLAFVVLGWTIFSRKRAPYRGGGYQGRNRRGRRSQRRSLWWWPPCAAPSKTRARRHWCC
jgi:hypothetical protein